MLRNMCATSSYCMLTEPAFIFSNAERKRRQNKTQLATAHHAIQIPLM